MANNSISRINTNFGIRTGWTDNSGLTIGEDYGVISTSGASGSATYSTYRQDTYLNIGPLSGNLTLNINATASYITDNLVVMVAGNGTSPFNLTLGNSMRAGTSSVAVPAGKYMIFDGTFNGTAFIGTVQVTA